MELLRLLYEFVPLSPPLPRLPLNPALALGELTMGLVSPLPPPPLQTVPSETFHA